MFFCLLIYLSTYATFLNPTGCCFVLKLPVVSSTEGVCVCVHTFVNISKCLHLFETV